ncbi:threonine--tRNA ligase [Candidatus Woesearchaeota archaeon]|nr:threonine--tRNA ligase [Candidatus Woesearchaeota archaeon]
MKILTIHADYIEFEAKKKAFAKAEEGIKEGKQRIEECLVVFSAVEKRDEADLAAVEARYCSEVENILGQVKASKIVLYPYAHLSNALAAPQHAEEFLKKVEKILSKKYSVFRAPFGWYKSFTVACKGHPLSELSREFGPEAEAVTEKVIAVTRLDPKVVRATEKKDPNANATYVKLLNYLDENKAHYQLIDHAPEGRTDLVSPMRGNKPSQAAKCMVVMVKTAKDEKRFVLGVVPGDAKLNLNAVKELFKGTYASFATPEIAEELAASVSGTILPFSFNAKLELIVDPRLLENEELYFNAARLDRSMVLKTKDYVRLTKPRQEQIADYSAVPVVNLKREAKDEAFVAEEKKLSAEEKVKLSAAILVGAVLKKMYPTSSLGGCGFYQDQAFVDMAGAKLRQEDLVRVEKEVAKAIASGATFGKAAVKDVKEKLQQEIVADLGTKAAGFKLNEFTFTSQFKDPFVGSLKEIGAFKITHLASAYWKNNANNEQLTRLYVVAFGSTAEMEKYVKAREEAENRSHLKIGKEMGLFVVSELVGPGLPLLAPKGMIIRQEIINYLWSLHKDKGYQQVWTPHIARDLLYKTSGHWDKFGDELFKVKGKVDDFVLKPMNCPHHMQIYDAFSHSYKDMPVRFFEPATVYRDEKSGQLTGLSRVRAITQDDGHLFCRVGQITQEVGTIVSIISAFYKTLHMDTDYWVSLSVRGEDKSKYLGSDDVWKTAEAALEKAAKEHALPYKRREGEAAFYGPKLDFMFKDALGREWQLATIQCDFNLPERFNLSYMNEEGKKERPVVIHRAISGSLERFMSVLIEHFAGKFPLWLNPVQVKVLTVNDSHKDFAAHVASLMRREDLRVEIDDRVESIGKKVRDAQVEHVNYIVTVGDKEMAGKKLAVRSRSGEVRFDVPVEGFVKELVKERDERRV